MWRNKKHFFVPFLMALCSVFSVLFFSACENGTESDESVSLSNEQSSSFNEQGSSSKKQSSSSNKQSSSSKKQSSSSKKLFPDSLTPNDKEYPYAGIPRIVIETEERKEVNSLKTEIPAKLQIWDKKAESEVFDLTIRGRGNTSWELMPKKSYKIEFAKKQSLLGMPKDKDWALIANYADKSLIRNYIAYSLSTSLGASYAPRCAFAELYLNGEYLGVYLLSETIKIAEKRVNIPKDDNSYIVEFDVKLRKGEQAVYSHVINDKKFRVHDPKNASEAVLDTLRRFIEDVENFLKEMSEKEKNEIEKWFDVEESIKHYWVQEITKNPDGGYFTSIYFTWVKGGKLKMGPVWDFDLAYGNSTNESVNPIDNLMIRLCSWNKYLFRDSLYKAKTKAFWKENEKLIVDYLDTIESMKERLAKPALNNFKRWNILPDTSGAWHPKHFEKYGDAVDDLKDWLSQRLKWIGAQKMN